MQTKSLLRRAAVLAISSVLVSPTFGQNRGQPDSRTRAEPQMLSQELAFPTGDRSTSVVVVERHVPAEVRARAVFEYDLRLINLTQRELHDVVLTEHFSPNFRLQGADPRPPTEAADALTWRYPRLAPGANLLIRIRGTTERPENLSLCSTLTLSDVGCTNVRVVQPDLTFTRSAPPEVLLCDPIPLQYLVGNPGSGVVRNVRISENLPAGMTTSDGKTGFVIDVGDLAPGQTRDFTVMAQATKPGEYRNAALARAEEDGGLSRDASGTIVVRRPILEVTMRAPEYRYAGRPGNFEITVKNTGDAPARDTVLTDTLPNDTELLSADGGKAADGVVTWALGTLQPGAAKTVRLSLRSGTIGTIRNRAVAKAYCAEGSTFAPVDIRGVAAVLLEMRDDPDPIEIGATTTYTIDVTNQGTINDGNLVVTVEIPPEEEYVSSEGATRGILQDKTLHFAPLGTLAPKDKATWKVVVKGNKVADVRFKVTLKSNATGEVPVEKTESTHIY